MRTPPRSDSGETTPQNTHKKWLWCKPQEDFLFQVRSGAHSRTPLRGRGPWTPSSWGREYLKEKIHNSIVGDHTVRKQALHNLPPWQAKWSCARSRSSLPSPCSLPGTWGCKSWIIVPSSLSLPDSYDIQGHELRAEPGLIPKAVKEDLCSGDKTQSAHSLTSALMSADAYFFVLC